MSLNYNCLCAKVDFNSGIMSITWADVVEAFRNGHEIKVVVPVAENFIPVEIGDNCSQYIGTIREIGIDDNSGDPVYVAAMYGDSDGALTELYALDPGDYLAASIS